ncbi:MAG: hypothetical protein COB93_07575 [Sneathiella sp.]|nr:MAG: hypothetical protein COB93_07575 [Sneathiella sp.]
MYLVMELLSEPGQNRGEDVMTLDVLNSCLEPENLDMVTVNGNVVPMFPDSISVAKKRIAPVSACHGCRAQKKSICAALEEEEREKFGRTRLIRADAPIFRAFDAANYFFIVISGEVRLSNLLDDGRRQITAFKTCGDLLGNQLEGHYTTDAEAVCDTIICQFPFRALDSMSSQNAGLHSAMLKEMRAELDTMRRHAILLGRKTPVEKITTFLKARADMAESQIDHMVAVKLPMGRRDIADYLGLTIETVSRTLSKLKQLSIIDIPSAHDIVIKDMEELALLAEGRQCPVS